MVVEKDRVATLEALLATIDARSQQNETGRLEIFSQVRDTQRPWHLYFELGRLTWATGGVHPQRRWRRQFVRACRDSDLRSSYPAQEALRMRDRFEAWDYHLILALHGRKQVEVEQVRQVVAETTVEVLFDILQVSSDMMLRLQSNENLDPLRVTWSHNRRPSQELKIPSSWVLPSVELVARAQEKWQAWSEAGLGPYSPDLCPTILDPESLKAQVAPETFKNLTNLLNGDRSFRDLAVIMRCEPLKVARPLLPCAKAGAIAFDRSDDLPPRLPNPPRPKPTQNLDDVGRRRTDTKLTPLVACIDPDPHSCELAERLLSECGYRNFSIREVTQVLATLVAKKPDLILLDPNLPTISGYELCAQARRIATLQNIPIVIVTGNDGIADRVRAKMVGATSFVAKPLSKQKLQEVAREYLGRQLTGL